MPKIRMQRVDKPDPKTTPVIECAVTPVMKGDGDTDYSCPGCAKTLLRKVGHGQIQDVVFKCPHCGAYSKPPTVHHSKSPSFPLIRGKPPDAGGG